MVRPRDSSATPGTVARSHDAEGWTLDWVMPESVTLRFACDVEGPSLEDALLLPETFGGQTPFRQSWVFAEVVAKLLDIPILEWLHLHRSGSTPRLPGGARGLVVPGVAGDRVLAFGWTPSMRSAREVPERGDDPRFPGFGLGRVLVMHDTNAGVASRDFTRREAL